MIRSYCKWRANADDGIVGFLDASQFYFSVSDNLMGFLGDVVWAFNGGGTNYTVEFTKCSLFDRML